MKRQCGGSGQKTMVDVRDISADLANEAFTNALRRHAGFGQLWSIEELAIATGISARTLNGYYGGETGPCFWRLQRLSLVLGPEFVNDYLAMIRLGGARRLAGGEVSPLELNKQVVELAGMIADAAEDLKFTPKEIADLADAVRHLMPIMQDFVTANSEAGA